MLNEMSQEIKNRAEQKHRNSHPEQDFMAGGQRSAGLRRSTGTYKLKEISWQEIRDQI